MLKASLLIIFLMISMTPHARGVEPIIPQVDDSEEQGASLPHRLVLTDASISEDTMTQPRSVPSTLDTLLANHTNFEELRATLQAERLNGMCTRHLGLPVRGAGVFLPDRERLYLVQHLIYLQEMGIRTPPIEQRVQMNRVLAELQERTRLRVLLETIHPPYDIRGRLLTLLIPLEFLPITG